MGLEPNEQKERKNRIKCIMELLRNSLDRCVYKNTKINQIATSFGVELDQRQEEEASNEMCQVAGSGRWWMNGEEGESWVITSSAPAQLLELLFRKIILVVLGTETC